MSRSGGGGLSIGDLSAATGLGRHTLRYWDDVGLIPLVERNEAGHRRFTDDHVRWVGLLDRLRTSGMSIQRMREYAELAVRGDETGDERRRLLEEHAADLRARIDELRQCLGIVEAKIDLYAGRLEEPGRVWELVEEARRGEREGRGGIRAG